MLVLDGLYSTTMDSFLLYIPFKGKERPEQTKLFPAKLPAGYNCAESDSAQC